MSKEKLEECFKGYLEQANNLGERGFCQDTDDYQEFLKDAIDELFGYMYECGFSANKKQAECYKQALEPFQDEYFKDLDTKKIAELAKKSLRITTYNRNLENALGEIAAKNRCEFHFNNLIQTIQVMNDFIEDFKKILDIISRVKDEVQNENT